MLVVASNEGDIFFIDPYKSHENLFKFSAVTLPAHKIHSIDVLWTKNGTYLFWSDKNSKALYSTIINNPVRKKSNRTTREVNSVDQIVRFLIIKNLNQICIYYLLDNLIILKMYFVSFRFNL